MSKRIQMSWLFAAGLSVGLCGCPANSSQHTIPEDPLFVNKTPVKLDAESVTNDQPVVIDPEVPPVPAVVALARKNADRFESRVEQVSGSEPGSADALPSAKIHFSP